MAAEASFQLSPRPCSAGEAWTGDRGALRACTRAGTLIANDRGC